MYAIWLLPNEKDELYLKETIDSLSLKFNSPRFLPHITIYGLLNLDYIIIEKAIKNSIHSIKPFIVTKLGIKQSNDIWKTLFIDIKMNRELEVINKNLNLAFSKLSKYKFFPHISLIYKKMNKIDRIRIIQNLKIKNEFIINRIAILKFSNKVSEWKTVQITNL